MAAATRASWKTQPLPQDRESLSLPLQFSSAEAERLKLGHRPESMDDKWFIFFEDGWLYFHRSWTGHAIFGVRLEAIPNGVRVTDAWASRDIEQYNSSGQDADIEMVRQLIRSRLLD